MKQVTIQPKEIVYEPGELSSYIQGIKGRENYSHSTRGKIYNGEGGVRIINFSTVTIYGIIKDNNKEVGIDIDKRSILDEFERSNFTEKFSQDLTNNLPDEITLVENDYGKFEISETSCREIYFNMHPKKAQKRYGNK
ncbi:hypothetical protein CHF27_013375 [Romboutsia maritimum]|uniref:Uncharacterized protein n=1 Tax=Romboutsia maritimum TaxID=2020948 RepID=A0A371IPP0_9FIRM|nr:hypothetical protein [Romboutsia maritimum]RDY22450.1 hypothetical protein CHF27_013375 [Romboutsia maritimum]